MSNPHSVSVHDIVQINPTYGKWGPVLVFVTEIREWGIIGHFFGPPIDYRGQGPATFKGKAWIRVPHDQYARIGPAQWVDVEDAKKDSP